MTTPRNHTDKEDYDPVLLGMTVRDIEKAYILLAQMGLLMDAYPKIVCQAVLHKVVQRYGYALRRRVNGWDNNYQGK
jgi:hypothetical protein